MAMKVDEMRTLLAEKGVDKKVLAKTKKEDLVKMMKDMATAKPVGDNLMEALLQPEEQPEVPMMQAVVPQRGSAEWHDFVMSKFQESELDEGHPTCVGLRRVAEMLLGEIVDSKPVQVIVDPTHGYACVQYEIKFAWKLSFNVSAFNTFDDGPSMPTRTFGDTADCSTHNTPSKYAKHAPSTASTKAESRALRKALMLHTITAEEAATEDGALDENATLPINENTKSMAIARIKRFNYDEKELLESIGVSDRSLEQLTKKEGQKLLEEMNKRQKG